MGKTAVFLFAVARMKVRTVLVISPKYFDRWLTDLSQSFASKLGKTAMLELDNDDIVMVRGSKSLASIINQASAGELKAKVLMISSTTYFQYLKHFRWEGIDDKYGNVHPVDLWKTLGGWGCLRGRGT